MNKKQKRFTILGVLVLFLIVAGIAGMRYFPLNKIWKVDSVPETEFIKQPGRAELPNTLYCDFEVDPKTGNTNGLYNGIAHSGHFSAKAFGKNSYSIAIDRTPGQISRDPLNAAGVSTWVYIFPTSHEINGAFVFSVNNDLGVNVCWKSVPVSGPGIPQGKWFKISGLFDLSDIKWKPNYKIQVYFWNNSSCDILVDDYYIVFGKSKERRGDSTLVDMTKGLPFRQRFNTPPYPFIYLEAADIGNGNSIFLVNDHSAKEGKIGPADRLVAGKFSGITDGLDDLLVISANGNKECFHYFPGKGRFEKVKFTPSPGRNDEQVIVERLGNGNYSAKQYDPSTKKYIQVYTGKSVGRDTLKPGDRVFTGFMDATGRSHTFRYNRDWRFDLKEIRFSDTAFQVIANIDFTGYEEDHNPKYYEKLVILQGKFISSAFTSFCVVAGNCHKTKGGAPDCTKWANLPVLPDKVQIYNYPETKQ